MDRLLAEKNDLPRHASMAGPFFLGLRNAAVEGCGPGVDKRAVTVEAAPLPQAVPQTGASFTARRFRPVLRVRAARQGVPCRALGGEVLVSAPMAQHVLEGIEGGGRSRGRGRAGR